MHGWEMIHTVKSLMEMSVFLCMGLGTGWMQVLEKGHQSLLILGKGLCVFGSFDPKISCFGQGLESSRTGRGREGEKEEGGILKTGSLQGQVTVREVGKEGSGVRV